MQSSACCWLLAGSLLLVTPGRSEDGHEEHSHHPPKGPGSGHWNYGGQTAWSLDFHHCGGEAQSPIDIQLNNTLFEPWLLPILVAGYDVPEEEKLRLRNNGHTVVLDLPDTLLIHGGLPEQYRASQLHFHWGSLDTPGSEHSVDGQRFPGEIHVVHYSTNYSSIKEAMMQPGGLAVLGAFIEAGLEENPTYEYLLNYFPQVINEGERSPLFYKKKNLIPVAAIVKEGRLSWAVAGLEENPTYEYLLNYFPQVINEDHLSSVHIEVNSCCRSLGSGSVFWLLLDQAGTGKAVSMNFSRVSKKYKQESVTWN
ncbi:carbonic anhydrase 9-like [Rhinatrema bivittatum]|uniref:carbonic anhydrase 9-like n=1 Tax=Rhinatrema bivittatum TaxID=194408 RepID=UPI00112D847F|nr:carbonic anhydrase 9-like [Rhinatrema bivittatum]